MPTRQSAFRVLRLDNRMIFLMLAFGSTRHASETNHTRLIWFIFICDDLFYVRALELSKMSCGHILNGTELKSGTISALSPLAIGLSRGRRMLNSLMLLAVEANRVIALRLMKLMRGGKSGRREANLMVSEKIQAAFEATASLLAGASGDKIVHQYRRHVAANAKRLGKFNSGRSKGRALKRTRRRRK